MNYRLPSYFLVEFKFQNFPGPVAFFQVPVLENARIKFQDFPGFPGPIGCFRLKLDSLLIWMEYDKIWFFYIKCSSHEWINNFFTANLISPIIVIIWLLNEWCKIQIKPKFNIKSWLDYCSLLVPDWHENLTGVSICIICHR